MSVIVIGSGLAAVGAIKALRKRGIKPIVLDIASSHDNNSNNLKDQLRSDVLRKKIKPELQYSNMKGGFSNVWGGSVLCPSKSELCDWPSKAIPTQTDYEECTEGITYTAADDGLNKYFSHPNLTFSDPPQDPSAINLINKFEKLSTAKNQEILFNFGRARQFIDYKNGSCIYSAKSEIEAMEKNNHITYIDGADVQKITEESDKVIIEYILNGSKENIEASCAFIGSGAANTTKLLAKYCKLYDSKIKLKYADGFVLPFFMAKHIEYNKEATQSSIFLELKDIKKSNTFSHIQISRPNKIILDLLKYQDLPDIFKKAIIYSLGHTYTALCAIHSNISGYYETSLTQTRDELLITKQIESQEKKRILKEVSAILNSCGAYNIPSISKNLHAHFYFGGSFPMKEIPTKINDTDILGRPNRTQRIYAIDSSVFPTIPATTIGLLGMANGYRIGRLAKL
jgi:hypothetical protein